MKAKKRVSSLILAAVMMLTAMPLSSVWVVNAADIDQTPQKIALCTSGVSNNDFVYYGSYKTEDIKWKVLDATKDNAGETNGMFLLSEYLLEQSNVPFESAWNSDDNDGQNNQNEWQHSDAQIWCTTFADNNAFAALEKSAIKSVSKTDNTGTYYSLSWGASSLNDEKVFYLSAEEGANYIGANDGDAGLIATTSSRAAGGWWLRSPDSIDADRASAVNEYGAVYRDGVDNDYPGVRPAFNLNRDAILFTSATGNGKSSGTVGVDALKPVPMYVSDTGREWKTTLLDSGRNGFKAYAEESTVTREAKSSATKAAVGYTDWSVDVKYMHALPGSNEYVSAMLCDAKGEVLYYGNIAQGSANGTQAVDIPAGLDVGEYTLKVFSEQLNGEKKTDYASDFQDIALEVTPSVPTPADYRMVDDALKKIPADLSVYTDASVAALNKAKAAVIRDKNITEQATVNGYATAILKAIDELEKKTVVPDLVPDEDNDNNNNNKDNNNKVCPLTGDNSHMFLWLAVFTISTGGIATVGIVRKTRKKRS